MTASHPALYGHLPTARLACGNPRHHSLAVLENINALGKSGEGNVSRHQWFAAIKCRIAGIERAFMDHVALAFRPVFQKFDCVSDARDLLDHVFPISYEDWALEKLCVHQFLQNLERVGQSGLISRPHKAARSKFVVGCSKVQEGSVLVIARKNQRFAGSRLEGLARGFMISTFGRRLAGLLRLKVLQTTFDRPFFKQDPRGLNRVVHTDLRVRVLAEPNANRPVPPSSVHALQRTTGRAVA